MCADRNGGGLRIYDPQTDRRYSGIEIDLAYTNHIRLTGDTAPYLLRVDNLAPDKKVMDKVLKGSKSCKRGQSNG